MISEISVKSVKCPRRALRRARLPRGARRPCGVASFVLLPVAVVAWHAARPEALPPWAWMWGVAAAIFAGAKADTLARAGAAARCASRGRLLGYVLLWPGLDAEAFLAGGPVERPRAREWAAATAKVAIGTGLLWGVVPRASAEVAGHLGMVGIAFLLFFGGFHVVSLLWRAAGVDARPLYRSPLLARSPSDLWGRRWNLAFVDWMRPLVFGPLARREGPAAATLAVFLVSGLLHDAVVSLPAGAGFGLPTAYFLLQGVAVLLERSRLGRAARLRDGIAGRVFTAAVALPPALLLFHAPFVERVALPFLRAIGAR